MKKGNKQANKQTQSQYLVTVTELMIHGPDFQKIIRFITWLS